MIWSGPSHSLSLSLGGGCECICNPTSSCKSHDQRRRCAPPPSGAETPPICSSARPLHALGGCLRPPVPQIALTISTGKLRPTLPGFVHPPLARLVSRCCEFEPARRPSIAQVVNELLAIVAALKLQVGVVAAWARGCMRAGPRARHSGHEALVPAIVAALKLQADGGGLVDQTGRLALLPLNRALRRRAPPPF